MSKNPRRGRKLTLVVEAFKELDPKDRKPDVLRKMAKAAGVSEKIIEKELGFGLALWNPKGAA